MNYRPQSAYPPPPPGWVDEEFEYYFDSISNPALAQFPANQIPLSLQPDCEFHLRGIMISGNAGNIALRLWEQSAGGHAQISQVLVPADRAYSSSTQGNPPIGKMVVPFEPEILCEAGSQLFIDLDTY
jgi:hypothetical protein